MSHVHGDLTSGVHASSSNWLLSSWHGPLCPLFNMHRPCEPSCVSHWSDSDLASLVATADLPGTYDSGAPKRPGEKSGGGASAGCSGTGFNTQPSPPHSGQSWGILCPHWGQGILFCSRVNTPMK